MDNLTVTDINAKSVKLLGINGNYYWTASQIVVYYSSGLDKSALNDAITAAETLYNSIKDDTTYSTIAATLKTALDTAKDVAGSDTADQDAVDAATTAITTAKTNAEAAKKDVDDTTEANKVSTQIAALPAKEAVKKDDKDKVEAVKAAYDALTDDQKKKVSPETLKKLTDAEDKLAVLQAMSEVSAKTGSDMTYTGKPIQLINTPTTALPEGYKMVYAVTTENKAPTDESLYTTSIPAKTDAGT